MLFRSGGGLEGSCETPCEGLWGPRPSPRLSVGLCTDPSFSISPSKGYSGLISFRMDWLDLLAVQGTLESLLQYHSSKPSILQPSAFFIHPFSMPFLIHPFPLPSLHSQPQEESSPSSVFLRPSAPMMTSNSNSDRE